MAISAAVAAPVVAQDAVVERKDDGGTLQRSGKILEWSGITLSLEQAGRIRKIDGEKIVSVDTLWPGRYHEGLQLLKQRQFAPAIESLKVALRAESRRWAKAIILSKLVRCYHATGDIVNAAETFIQIVAIDPQTRFLNLAPLPWANDIDTAAIQTRAKRWVEIREPAVQLIAASWLVGTDPGTARPVLEALATDIDPRIAALAVGQLWRIRRGTMTVQEINVWKRKLETMPKPLRAGPQFAVATMEARSNLNDNAIEGFMRIAILFPELDTLAAPALHQAASIMQSTGKPELAQSLLNELRSQYPESSWTKLGL